FTRASRRNEALATLGRFGQSLIRAPLVKKKHKLVSARILASLRLLQRNSQGTTQGMWLTCDRKRSKPSKAQTAKRYAVKFQEPNKNGRHSLFFWRLDSAGQSLTCWSKWVLQLM